MSRAGLIDRVLRQPLKQVLLWLLSLVEKKPSAIERQRLSLWRRDVHISTGLVAAFVSFCLFAVLLLEVGLSWVNVAGLLLFTVMLVTLFIFYFRHDHPEILHDEEAVALLGLLMVGSVWLIEFWVEGSRHFEWMSFYGIPLAATSLFTALLLQPRLAIILTVVLSLIFGVINDFSIEASLVACFGGLTGVARSLYVRTRKDVSRAGLWVALAQSMTLVVLGLLQRWPLPELFGAIIWACAGGLLSSLIVLGFLPYLENFFSRLTNIKLLEMSDVNHPLLKRMSLEAPGTYHHSLIMASLAEAAADAIGANGLLCRVGAYFHDIGKMVKPEYFVENQGSLGNPHDPLPPNMSKIVIQSHIKEGVALGRQYNLDKAIVNFIPMHHGTSRIEYFYRRAIEQSSDLEEVDAEEYRYPGPRPHTKETAIVMIADSVEASVRTLEDPTHQRLQDQVNKIIQDKMADGQFDDVPLTMMDLRQISDSFVNTLTGIYHTRIKYPTPEGPEPEAPSVEAKA